MFLSYFIKRFEKFIKSYLVVILLLLFSPLYSSKYDSIKYSFPKIAIRKLVQDFDREYFPLFLRTLDEMRNNDTMLINKYFNRKERIQSKIQHVPNLDKYESIIEPVYIFPNDRSIKYNVTFPIKWNDPNYSDPSWNLWYKSLVWIKPYIISNNNDSTLTGFKIINDYLLSFSVYPESSCRFIFGDHACAERIKILTLAYNKYFQGGYYNPDFEHRLLNAILYHIFYMVSLEQYASWHNHGILTDEGLIFSLKDLDIFNLQEYFINFAFKRIFEQYKFSLTEEGIHKEHSPCYHHTFTRKMNNIIQVAKELNIEIPAKIIDLNNKANTYLKYIDVSRYDIPIGNCKSSFVPYKIQSASSKNTFKHGIKVFPKSGWVFIRDSTMSISIIAQANFHSYSLYHQHETSFILNIDGLDFIIDPGIFSLDKTSPYHDFMTKSRAHNVLLLNDQDFNSNKNSFGLAGITRYYPFNGEDSINSNIIVEMTHPHYNDLGVKLHRQLAFIESNTIIVKDIVTSDSIYKCSQLFHLRAGAIINNSKKGINISWKDQPYNLIFKFKGEYDIIEGQMNPVQGWYFPKWNLAEPNPVLVIHQEPCTGEIETSIEITTKNRLKSQKIKPKDLFKKLDTQEKRKLVHQPLPSKWTPRR